MARALAVARRSPSRSSPSRGGRRGRADAASAAARSSSDEDGERASVSERVRRATCGGIADLLSEVLPGAFEVKPDATFRPRPRLRRRHRREEAPSRSSTTSARRPAGATASRSLRRTSSSRTTRSAEASPTATSSAPRHSVRSVRALDAKTVKVVLRAPFVDWRFASSPSSCRDTRSPARTSRASGRTGSTTRRRAGRSGAAPSSSGPGSAASS